MAHQLPYNLTFLLFLYFFFIIYDSRLLTFSIFTVYFLILKKHFAVCCYKTFANICLSVNCFAHSFLVARNALFHSSVGERRCTNKAVPG